MRKAHCIAGGNGTRYHCVIDTTRLLYIGTLFPSPLLQYDCLVYYSRGGREQGIPVYIPLLYVSLCTGMCHMTCVRVSGSPSPVRPCLPRVSLQNSYVDRQFISILPSYHVLYPLYVTGTLWDFYSHVISMLQSYYILFMLRVTLCDFNGHFISVLQFTSHHMVEVTLHVTFTITSYALCDRVQNDMIGLQSI